jgi:hypothetical protein
MGTKFHYEFTLAIGSSIYLDSQRELNSHCFNVQSQREFKLIISYFIIEYYLDNSHSLSCRNIRYSYTMAIEEFLG